MAKNPTKFDNSLSPLARLIGPVELLPGESQQAYDSELAALLKDIGTNSPLAVMLTEQLYESLLWARRHGADKARLIVNAMVELLVDYHGWDEVRLALYASLSGSEDEEATALIAQLLEDKGHTIGSLRAAATKRCMDSLKVLDGLIQQQLNSARHLQKSIEALELKPLVMERMCLDIQNLKRDLNAIEHDEQAPG